MQLKIEFAILENLNIIEFARSLVCKSYIPVCKNTRMNPRGRWRRRRNLRRVPTTDLDRRWRAENSPLPLQNSVQVPVFLVIFMQYAEKYSIDLLEKGADKKKGQTLKNQTDLARSRARPGPCIGQLKVRYRLQNLSKAVPKTSGGFLLRCQLMSTSGSVGRRHSPQVAPAAQ